ncbi:hypothetical protein ACFQPA_15000 [Halomarina halobia]|uniref:Uncharacterized protein n=1 Tax=Halomarina halobia TaxID=3033386 RepID=A0ABD6A8W5_9EURY|nr:hypothetical protein [Halomarina sp. PSR21]
MNVPSAVDTLRRPEYTGENRCVPCTALNVLIAGALAAVVAVVSRPAYGAVVFAAAALVVYLRGYLVPGTPTITRRYFPPWLLRLFGKDPIAGVSNAGDAAEAGAGDRAAEPLLAAGVLTDADGGGIDLAPAFREEWAERTNTVLERGVEPDDVRAMFDADTVSSPGERSFVVDGNKSVRWESTAALAADVAAAEVLREHVDWAGFDRERRQSVLLGLRLFLRRCPTCDGPLSVTEERVDPCCQKPHLVAESACRDCGAALADAAVVDREGVDSVRTTLLR